MNQVFRRTVSLIKHGGAAAVLSLCTTPPGALDARAEDKPDFVRIERSGFTMEMPQWEALSDADQGGDGRYVIEKDALRVQVRWSLHGDLGLEEIEKVQQAVWQQHETEPVERRVEHPPGELRLHTLMLFGGRIWARETYVACRDSGVLVVVSSSGRPREAVEALHQRMLPTLQCRSGDLPRLREKWPFTDLPESFGIAMDGLPELAHADGRSIIIAKLPPDVVQSMAIDPDRAQAILASYASLFGLEWSVVDTSKAHNLTGDAWLWTLMTSFDEPLVATVFNCEADELGYILFATGAVDSHALRALSLRFGCPDGDSPSLLDRPGACEVGVVALCADHDPAQEERSQ